MGISTSYVFGTNTQFDDFIKESFERIGIIRNEITPLQLKSAIMSLNLELTEWQGKVPLSWVRKRRMFNLVMGQSQYSLPRELTRIVDVCASHPTRLNTGGTAFSTNTASGAAENCFNPQSSVGCTQTLANGSISYNYGVGNEQAIQYIGITCLPDIASYTLALEYSFDGSQWQTALLTPLTTYYANQITWFVIENAKSAVAWRVTETAGAILSLNQIYFDVPATSGPGNLYMLGLSYTEYMQIPITSINQITTSYFFNAQIDPYIIFWPSPGSIPQLTQYSAVIYTGYFYMADAANLFDSPDMPQRFYEALTSSLAARLAQKFAPDKYPSLRAQADNSFQIACMTDYEQVTLRIQPDFSVWSSK